MNEDKDRPPEKGEVTISAVVTRKDGTVEDLGVIARGKTDWQPGGESDSGRTDERR